MGNTTKIHAETVGAYAFAKATLWGTLEFSENLKKIGEGAFFQVHSGLYTGKVDFSNCYKLKTIPARAFAYHELFQSDDKAIVFPSTIVEIGEEAFANAMGCFFGGNAQPKIIGDRAFKGAKEAALQAKYLTKVEYIGEEAFQAEKYYLEMTIPASCTFIGDNAFYKKVKLKVTPGSYAEIWAQENGYEYDNGIEQDLSWLGQN